MSEKLKPCPFCGNEARLMYDKIVYVKVQCSYCDCCMVSIPTKELAIKFWNTRKKKVKK